VPCERVQLPGGGWAIVCGPKRRAKPCPCGSGLRATQLCDWKTPDGPEPTCSAPTCKACTHVPAPGKDLCPDHRRAWDAMMQARKNRPEP
jgi:hypothetical protein